MKIDFCLRKAQGLQMRKESPLHPFLFQRWLWSGIAAVRESRRREEECFLAWRCVLLCLAMAATQVFGEPSRCYFLGSCLPNCATDTSISLPLAVCSLQNSEDIGNRTKGLDIYNVGTEVVNIIVTYFPFWVIVQKKDTKGVGWGKKT